MLGSKSTRRGQAASSDQQSTLGGRDFPDVVEFVQVSWNGQEEWSFSNWDTDDTGIMMSRQHHDYQRESNPTGYFSPGQEFIAQGKTLILARENKLIPEISIQELTSDVIYEVDWRGNFTGFEWHASDHFDEMGFDESARKAIYDGLTYDEDKDSADWLHINSMSLLGQNHWYDETQDKRFNPENIIISSRNANFVAIISRATGDIVWRVGPDFSTGTPEHNLGQFVGQHHAHMIPNG
ncbi:MAG: arylsulfotransferase family protein, partial [Dehalococcoidales bacterium]